MNTSQFTSNFWNIYIAVIVISSFIGLAWLLFSQNKTTIEKDENGEVKTTGHSWDDIAEYNNPLPRWWFWLFVLVMIFGAGYLVLYPGLGDYKGVFGWSSKKQYQEEVAAAEAKYVPLYKKYADMPVTQMAGEAQAMNIGRNLFDTYCIQCHGSDAKGNIGFPNLTDHDWLWGGSPEKIQETITKGRMAVMPAWGPALGTEGVKDVAQYVLSLSGRDHDERRAKRGEKLFHGGPANCFACHGPEGKGVVGLGPNLTDDVWLWGGSEKRIIETITNGRKNQMPAWDHFMSEDQLKILSTYVWSLSNQDAIAKAEAEGSTTLPATDATPAADNSANAAASSDTSQALPAQGASTVVDNGVVKVYFASGKSDVAPNTADALKVIVDGVKSGKVAVISGFHDSTGNAAQNAELAKNRALEVKNALLKLGVSEDAIRLEKPASAEGSGSLQEARRVEVSLQ